MVETLRRWWPLPVALIAGLVIEAVFKNSYGELGEHAAGHLASAGALFPGLAMIVIMLWATPRARRQADVWLAAGAWAAALVVVMIGNLRVVNVIGDRPWTEENAAELGDGIPAFESGHDLAATGAWIGVGAAVLLTIVLLARGHISSRVAIGSVALSLVIPPFLSPGAGLNVVAVALCLTRRRRVATLEISGSDTRCNVGSVRTVSLLSDRRARTTR